MADQYNPNNPDDPGNPNVPSVSGNPVNPVGPGASYGPNAFGAPAGQGVPGGNDANPNEYAQQPYSQPNAYTQPAPGQPVPSAVSGYNPYYQPEPKWNPMAIAGFICSFIIALVGLILSIIGYSQTRKTGEKGKGLALAGIIISALSMLMQLLLVVLIVVMVANAPSGHSSYEYVGGDDYGYDYDYDHDDDFDHDFGYDFDDAGSGDSRSTAYQRSAHIARIDAVIARTAAALPSR